MAFYDYTECFYAECFNITYYAECHYAECHDASTLPTDFFPNLNFSVIGTVIFGLSLQRKRNFIF